LDLEASNSIDITSSTNTSQQTLGSYETLNKFVIVKKNTGYTAISIQQYIILLALELGV
jgi:hypothetical protein